MTDSDRKFKVLVVDDSKLMRKSATKMLGDEFDIILAEDGEEGWEALTKDQEISLVFSDINMPNLDGYGFLSRIRQSNDVGIQQIPVVIVTGVEDEIAAKELALEKGATDFITKPFNSFEIKARASAHASYQRQKIDIEQNTNKDPLTQLLNSHGFNNRLNKDISFCKRHHQPLAVLYLELLNTSELFDKFGQKACDSLIKHTARLLKNTVRKEDNLSRNSHSGFLISLPTAKTKGVMALAERIKKSINSMSIKASDSTFIAQSQVTVCSCSPLATVASEEIINGLLSHSSSSEDIALLQFDAEPEKGSISIDQLLTSLKDGQEIDTNDLDNAIQQLKPLLALIDSNEINAKTKAS